MINEKRILPHNQDAEQGLLGGLLVDNRGIDAVADFLKPEHFFMPAHQRIYSAILSFSENGSAVQATPSKRLNPYPCCKAHL